MAIDSFGNQEVFYVGHSETIGIKANGKKEDFRYLFFKFNRI